MVDVTGEGHLAPQALIYDDWNCNLKTGSLTFDAETRYKYVRESRSVSRQFTITTGIGVHHKAVGGWYERSWQQQVTVCLQYQLSEFTNRGLGKVRLKVEREEWPLTDIWPNWTSAR